MITPEILTSLAQSGTAGIVIIVVLIFLYYMREQNKTFLESINKISAALDGLVKEQTQMRIDVKGHHESVEQMTRSVLDATRNCGAQPRPKDGKTWG